MSTRLQVMMDDDDLREIKEMARLKNMSVAEWVRDALHAAKQNMPTGETQRKIEAIRAAVKYDFPTSDIDQMIGEIEKGYDAK